MIRDYLIPAIKARFPHEPFTFGETLKPIASLRSPCEALGQVEIFDDGDEITLGFADMTHGHFGCYERKLNEADKEEQVASDVIGFLANLLNDRVVIWELMGGVAGGWRVLRSDEETPKPSVMRRQFLWSREIKWRNS